MHDRGRLSALALGTGGFLLFLALVEIIGRLKLAGSTWPPITDVAAYMMRSASQLTLLRAISSTGTTMLVAYVAGVVPAILLATTVHLLPSLRPGMDRLAAFANAVPPMAISPVLVILTGSFAAGVSLAGLYVFFTVYVAARAGFEQPFRAQRDLLSVLGARPFQRLAHLDAWSALPMIATGMKQAIAPAMVGVILSEWFSGEGGVGLLLISAMRNLQIPLLWSAMFASAAMTLVLFGAMGSVERVVHKTFRG